MPAPWDASWATDAVKWFQQNPGKTPSSGQQFGNKVWNGSGFQDVANPNDPNQQTNWALQGAQQNAQKPLYDEATLAKLKDIFGPYFASQRSNLAGQMNRTGADVGRQAGAYAASQGLANPGAFTSGAQQRVASSFAPQFGNLEQNQLGSLLNATAASSQFGAQNNQFLAQLMMQKAGLDYQQQNQPSIWDYILGGVTGGVGALAGGIGSGLGKQWAGG
jgi:hypothetical protein